MAYTYSEPSGGVFADAVSEVRYLLGDTTPSAPFSLTDAEIQYELAQAGGNRRLAAANAAYRMATRYSEQAVTTKSVGNLSLTKEYSSTADRYSRLAEQLRSGSDKGLVGGPIFTADSTTPQFTLGMNDYEG